MESLLPWLKRLLKDCQPRQLWEYVEVNRIGLNPISTSSNRADDLLSGMKESAMSFGSRYVLPGMNLVIEAETIRK